MHFSRDSAGIPLLQCAVFYFPRIFLARSSRAIRQSFNSGSRMGACLEVRGNVHPGTMNYRELRRSWRVLVAAIVILLLIYYWFSRQSGKKTKTTPMADQSFRQKSTSLQAEGKHFTLDGKPFRILSGAIHYFRVVPAYWRDRLLKLKAMGLNTVETYIAWNVHEPHPGNFEFSGQYDVKGFITLAHSLGLYVIVRPGPYICAEWEFGGLPGWLLADPHMEIRSTHSVFMDSVRKYFDKLMPLLVPLQKSKGGPVIALQVENEYANFGSDTQYLMKLSDMMISHGIEELLFTSDYHFQRGQLPGIFKTVNFQENPEERLEMLKKAQERERPLMVMEYWTGWFDHWGEKHHTVDTDTIVKAVETILKMGASINLYMFHGGTNFGLMNGGNYDEAEDKYQSTVTSYDYDAPLSESGDITPKYLALRKLIAKYSRAPPIDIPANIPKASYGKVELNQMVLLADVLYHLPSISTKYVGPMEMLPHTQLYGYVIYRTMLTDGLNAVEIHGLKDYGLVMIDSKPVHVVERHEQQEVKVEHKTKSGVLDILVENSGRINGGYKMTQERKGIEGKVLLDGKPAAGWTIYSLEFVPEFLQDIMTGGVWKVVKLDDKMPPAFYKGSFTIKGAPLDTFLKMSGWTKGVVVLNGAVLGRFWDIGPQQTLYVPAPWLSAGDNVIIVFCLGQPHSDFIVELVDAPILG